MKKMIVALCLSVLSAAAFVSCAKNKYQPIGDYGTLANTTGVLSGSNKTYDDGENYTIEANFSWSELTAEAINDGAVMVYAKLGDGWTALPYSTHADTYSETINYSLNAGYVHIVVEGWDANGSPDYDYLNGLEIKVVLISKSELAGHPGVDLTQYDQVKTAFDLQ